MVDPELLNILVCPENKTPVVLADDALMAKLNAAIREGRYSENLWKDLTGATVQDLGQTWKADLEKKVGTPSPGKA